MGEHACHEPPTLRRLRVDRRAAKEHLRSTRSADQRGKGRAGGELLDEAELGEAAQIREEAAAYKNRVVLEAQGEAQRFISVYDEYAKAPDVTRRRLFLETMENVLKGSNKVIVDEKGGSGVIPYLPLPELNQKQGTTNRTLGGNN